MKANVIALIAAITGVSAAASRAALHTFDSASASPVSYTSAGNWTGGVPATAPLPPGEDVLINTGIAEFTPGGDFRVNSNFTVASGATFRQLAGNGAWMKIADGANTTATLNVNGVFGGPTNGNLFFGNGTNAVATVNVTGGQISASTILVNNGSTLTVSGSGATATGTTLELNAGNVTLSSGGAMSFTNFVFNGGTFGINNASFSKTGNFLVDVGRTFSMSGSSSVLSITGEFKPVGGTTTIAGGTVNASLISFDGVADTLDLSGGRINISGNFTGGIFTSSANKYVDFTTLSTGELFFSTGTLTGVNAMVADGRIRSAGAIDVSAFSVTEPGGTGTGVLVKLNVAAVPEPTTIGLLSLGGLVALRRRTK